LKKEGIMCIVNASFLANKEKYLISFLRSESLYVELDELEFDFKNDIVLYLSVTHLLLIIFLRLC